MNLVDVMMGGLVFSLASISSLQIYGSSLRWAHGHEQRQHQAAALAMALSEGSRQLRQPVDGAPGPLRSGDCTRAAADLVAALKQAPLGSGLTRVVDQAGELVSITVDASGLPSRRRWFSPAAYGLCGNAPLHGTPSGIVPLGEARP
jgi:hypothetical protein